MGKQIGIDRYKVYFHPNTQSIHPSHYTKGKWLDKDRMLNHWKTDRFHQGMKLHMLALQLLNNNHPRIKSITLENKIGKNQYKPHRMMKLHQTNKQQCQYWAMSMNQHIYCHQKIEYRVLHSLSKKDLHCSSHKHCNEQFLQHKNYRYWCQFLELCHWGIDPNTFHQRNIL